MWSFILKRLAQGVITVWFIATATFFAMHNVPGDPLLNDRAMTAAIRANVEAKYGLDKPVAEQYVIYLGNLIFLVGRLFSLNGRISVVDLGSHRAPYQTI